MGSIKEPSRRRFLAGGLRTGASAALLGVLAACGKGSTKLGCADPNALSPSDKKLRQSLHYVEASADPAKHCSNCLFFSTAASTAKCGGCKILQGSVDPNGYCDAWAAKA